MALILHASEPQTFDTACKNLKKGLLVAFPTETVYGLGAHALDKDAVLSIFTAKQRPLTDPVIVHIYKTEQANDLADFGHPAVKHVFAKLANTFWPGPLTMILPASAQVPPCVTANTGCVGIRMPSHPIAQQLLQSSELPIAAPSANRFGHVSPTTAQHVFDDLGDVESLVIIDGGRSNVGVESTVVKIDVSSVHEHRPTPTEQFDRVDVQLIVLRRGAITQQQLQTALNGLEADLPGAEGKQTPIVCSVGVVSAHHSVATTTNAEAPGQLLKHYAPNLPTYLVSQSRSESPATHLQPTDDANSSHELSSAVVLDFAGSLSHLKTTSLAYRDLSPSGSFDEAAYSLFDCLRWTERVEKASVVILCDVALGGKPESLDELGGALYDRMFRAASGNTAHLK